VVPANADEQAWPAVEQEQTQPLRAAGDPRQRRDAETTRKIPTQSKPRWWGEGTLAEGSRPASIDWRIVIILPRSPIAPSFDGTRKLSRRIFSRDSRGFTCLAFERHKQVFSLRTPDYGTELGTSFPRSFFDELELAQFLKASGNRRELKSSTRFSVRNGKKLRHHWVFSWRRLWLRRAVRRQDIDSTGRFTFRSHRR
jgi:hypothetical protein